MYVLGIETSCDETAAAIYSSEKGLLSHALYPQIKLHARYGGVVPELASRDHVRKLLSLIEEALRQANVTKQDLAAIAYTAGPGLVGALLVGASLSRALAYALNIPAITIHHMEAHLLAPLLESEKPQFPFLALVVSGGHSLLVHVRAFANYEILGETLDDAAGEAFDKIAKLLNLGLPGGPRLAECALKGDPQRFYFPRPMLEKPGLDFSFSGLKTHTRTVYLQTQQSDQDRADVARAFEEAIVDTLTHKVKRAVTQTQLQQLVVAGGVGANQRLRQTLQKLADKMNLKLFFPRIEFCTDNAAMAAFAGSLRLAEGDIDDLSIKVRARWSLEECSEF